MNRLEQARETLAWMVTHRRHLHQHPEVGLELPETHGYVARVLRDLGLDVEAHVAGGLSARVAGSAPDGVTVVLRADMDALPVTERAVVSYPSLIEGAMHACGHDLHMSMLLGAAKVLTKTPPRRDTVLVFQPGEESDRGALAVLEHANLRLSGEVHAFAVHVHATAPPGQVLWRPDVFMAYGDWFTIELRGPGGHASQPHLVGNPVEAAADITASLRRAVAELSEADAVVATVTESRIGNTVNVIPAYGRLRGTLRSLSPGSRVTLMERLQGIVSGVGDSHGLSGDVTIHEGYPAVVNDSAFMSRLISRLSEADISASVTKMPAPSMVIEDFAYFLDRWPGAMVYLGAQGPGNTSFNHSDDVVYDETAMAVGAALHLLVADGV